METFGRVKTLIIRGRGCKNDVIGRNIFFVILGTLLDVILEPKMHHISQFSSHRTPYVTIICTVWLHVTDHFKTSKIGILKTGVGGKGPHPLG